MRRVESTPRGGAIAEALAGGLACLLLATPIPAAAQPDGPAGQRQAVARPGTGTTVPLTADLMIHTTTVGPDGKLDSTETKQRVYRDSRGRTRVEAGTAVTISDPVARTATKLDTRSRSYRQTPSTHEASAATEETERRPLSSAPRPLGARTMQGTRVEGHAQTVTMPASKGRPAEKREVTIWHSAALRLPVQTRIVAASGARTVQTYSDIRTGEPAAGLFKVPAGYREAAAADTVTPYAVPASDLHTAAILNGQLHHRIRFANGGWSNWAVVGNTGTAMSVGAATTPAGDLHVAVVNTDGLAYHRVRFANGAWSNEASLDFPEQGSAISVAATPGGDVHVAAVIGHYVHVRTRSANGSWSTWAFIDGAPIGDVAASATSGGDLHVAALHQWQVLHGIRLANGTWSGWGFLGNPGLATQLSVATTAGNDLHTAAVINGQVQHRYRFANGSWTDWGFLGNPGTASAIGVSTTPGGDLHTAAVIDGQVQHRVRFVDGSWSPWALLGNPGTATDVAVATATPTPPDTTPCPVYAPDSVPVISFGIFLGAAVVEATTDGAKGCRFIDSAGYGEPPLAGTARTSLGMDNFQWLVYDDGGPIPFVPWYSFGVIEWVAGRDGVDPSYFQTLVVLYIDE